MVSKATKLYKGIIQAEHSQSVCTKVLLDVIQISEKQVVTPPIKALLDIIKAAAFAKCKPGTTRDVRENDTEITSESSEEKLEIEQDLIKKEHMFTPSLLRKWDFLKRRMQLIIKVYCRDIKKLKQAEMMCRRARSKMIEALEAIHEGNIRQIKEEPFVTEQALSKRCARNLRKSLTVYRKTKILYWRRLDRESYLRLKLKEVEWQLHLEMEKRIEWTIERGLSKLRRICRRWQIPYVNGQHVSRDIMLLTSAKIFFTIPPQSDFMSPATPLTFYFPQKVVSDFVYHYYGETSTLVHSHYLDAENIYVKCIEPSRVKGKEELDLQAVSPGQHRRTRPISVKVSSGNVTSTRDSDPKITSQKKRFIEAVDD
ncbi:hypothetical protein ACJMK2_044305 [Sinanodonta woodiana]|uniref:Uncharacterized protein n=1 Tax=Sinanodonta woodiana TaxID=1069815 RepID=A0ABD3VZR0_SINWO